MKLLETSGQMQYNEYEADIKYRQIRSIPLRNAISYQWCLHIYG